MQRVEKLLEDAPEAVQRDLRHPRGPGRAMLEAIIAGERNPVRLTQLARGRMRGKIPFRGRYLEFVCAQVRVRLGDPAILHAQRPTGGTARTQSPPAHRIHREARIRRGNRRIPPPGVAGTLLCGGCDGRGGGDHALTMASITRRRAGLAGPLGDSPKTSLMCTVPQPCTRNPAGLVARDGRGW